MKLRTKFLLFVIILHAVALVLSFLIFKDNKIFFIASEVLILFSVYISWRLYNELIQPLNMLMQGTDAIKDRDFNVKFVKTGKYEMDELINVYNYMIDELRKERTKQEEPNAQQRTRTKGTESKCNPNAIHQRSSPLLVQSLSSPCSAACC